MEIWCHLRYQPGGGCGSVLRGCKLRSGMPVDSLLLAPADAISVWVPVALGFFTLQSCSTQAVLGIS
eukprot:6198738-Pleurochrysis_carterae.AAC.1